MSDTANQTAGQKPASKIDQAAERAYADAAGQKSAVDSKPEASADKPATAAPAKEASKPVAVTKAPAKAAATKKSASKKPAAKKTTKRTAPAKRTVTKKKEPKTMATKSNTNTKTNTETKMADMAAGVQDRAKAAYSKAGEVAGGVGEFSKGNMDAVVESGKILASGMQDMARETVQDAKSVFQQTTEDMRLMAAVKSPTELLKLQSEFARRNFDAVVKYGSKRTEANIKLANEAFAPIQNRMSVAGKKLSKAA